MRPDPTDQDRVAVDVKMLRRDRGSNVITATVHEIDGLPRGDMFEDHAQLGQALGQRLEHALDKHRLAIEDVDIRAGHLAVDAKRHTDLGHAFEDAVDLADIRDAARRIGGGARRIELGCRQNARFETARQIVGIDIVVR